MADTTTTDTHKFTDESQTINLKFRASNPEHIFRDDDKRTEVPCFLYMLELLANSPLGYSSARKIFTMLCEDTDGGLQANIQHFMYLFAQLVEAATFAENLQQCTGVHLPKTLEELGERYNITPGNTKFTEEDYQKLRRFCGDPSVANATSILNGHTDTAKANGLFGKLGRNS